jgi:hypothetical protein
MHTSAYVVGVSPYNDDNAVGGAGGSAPSLALAASGTSKMLGGASQTVSKIRVKYNGK